MRKILPSAARSLVLLAVSWSGLNGQIVGGGPPNGGAGNDIFNDTRSAAAFSVGPASGVFDDIRFWAIVAGASPYSPDIYWQVLGDSGGSPDDGTVVLSGHAVASPSDPTLFVGLPGYTTWRFDMAVGSESIGAGVFWLALHDGAPDPTGTLVTTTDLFWATADGGTPFQSESISASTGWAEYGTTTLAFALRGAADPIATPEPGTFGLTMLALLVLGRVLAIRRSARIHACCAITSHTMEH